MSLINYKCTAMAISFDSIDELTTMSKSDGKYYMQSVITNSYQQFYGASLFNFHMPSISLSSSKTSLSGYSLCSSVSTSPIEDDEQMDISYEVNADSPSGSSEDKSNSSTFANEQEQEIIDSFEPLFGKL